MITCIVDSCTLSDEKKQEVIIKSIFTPDLVIVNENPTLYYELQVTNTSNEIIFLHKLEIIDTANSKFFIAFEGDDLVNRFHLKRANEETPACVVPPQTSAIIYLEIKLPNNKSSFTLTHNLDFTNQDGKNPKVAHLTISTVSTTRLIIGAPLSGGPWTTIYDPSWERGHRRVVYTIGGIDRIPGRFAIDFIKMDGDGKNTIRNEDEVKNWIGYGADVLAVADGIVISTNDEFSESPTLSAHEDYLPEKATGNYISLEIGTNTFAFYEHLKPRSIKVKPGQFVKKGDIIGSLGFTGNTTGPHLHFHIANMNSSLGAEGVAYEFDSFFILGSYPSLEKFGKVTWIPTLITNKKRIAEHPAPNSVIVF